METNDIKRCEQLKNLIHTKIHQQGSISVAEYIELALYHPLLGYYMQDSMQIGKDFITAPHLGNWLASCIGDCWQKIRHEVSDIIEFGPGSGKLCFDFLTYCKDKGSLPKNYYLIELSPGLKKQQQKLLSGLEVDTNIEWLDSPPTTKSLIIANEFFDAWPVEQFIIQDSIQQRHITLDQSQNLIFINMNIAKDSIFYQEVDKLCITEKDYYSEIQLNYASWFIEQYQKSIVAGMIIIDYGMHQQAYYAKNKYQGTIQCFTNHRAHSDFLIYPGLQDITAHIDFSALKAQACLAGWQLAGYSSQAQFMLQNGLDQLLITTELSLEDKLAVKQLLMPSEMGEAFKVIGFTKNLAVDWFKQHNKQGILN
jgi:SAM-dependent MidA family methyltransferase